jgi:hypothetical protein
MSNEVYANMMEISCKAGAGKSICAFPDPCFTPPQTPATPPGVPIPYPNTGMASDSADGSTSVQISGQELMLKNKSAFKKSTGDEAGCAPKKGLISSKNTGKVYFKSWSMDVKVEGENVVRHLDLTTHNHACEPANEAAPWPHVDNMVAPETFPPCEELQQAMVDEADDLPNSMSRVHEDSVTRGESSTIAGAYSGRSPPSVTIATGSVIGGGPGAPTSPTPAHSRARIGKERSKRYAKGKKKPGKSGAKPCGKQAAHQYPKDKNNHRHCEAKLIEDFFSNGGQGQLVLNVSRPVCENCAALIRNVNCGPNGEKCNKVVVCDNNQSPEAKERLKC